MAFKRRIILALIASIGVAIGLACLEKDGCALQEPSFEIFLASRKGIKAGGFDAQPIPQLVERLQLELSYVRKLSGNAGLGGGERNLEGQRRRQGSGTHLWPDVPLEVNIWLKGVPVVVWHLADVLGPYELTSEEASQAASLIEYCSEVELGIKTNLEVGPAEANCRSLEFIYRWFDALCGDKRYLGVMVPISGIGPMVGMPIELSGRSQLVSSKAVGDGFELRLFRVARAGERYVLQCLDRDAPLWAIVVSDAPTESVQEVRFANDTPLDLGAMGGESISQ